MREEGAGCRARRKGGGGTSAGNPNATPYGCARGLTHRVPAFSSVKTEMTLAWQGFEGRRDTLL